MAGVVALDSVAQTQRRLLKPGWPLFVLFVGFPIWWALGLGGFIWPVMAFPMLLSLLRRKRIYAPPGMLLWVGFLVWMFATGIDACRSKVPRAVSAIDRDSIARIDSERSGAKCVRRFDPRRRNATLGIGRVSDTPFRRVRV